MGFCPRDYVEEAMSGGNLSENFVQKDFVPGNYVREIMSRVFVQGALYGDSAKGIFVRSFTGPGGQANYVRGKFVRGIFYSRGFVWDILYGGFCTGGFCSWMITFVSRLYT